MAFSYLRLLGQRDVARAVPRALQSAVRR